MFEGLLPLMSVLIKACESPFTAGAAVGALASLAEEKDPATNSDGVDGERE